MNRIYFLESTCVTQRKRPESANKKGGAAIAKKKNIATFDSYLSDIMNEQK